MNSHHLLQIFRKRNALSICRLVLLIALYNSVFCGTATALPSFKVEDICRISRLYTIDIRHYPSGTLTSSTTGIQDLTCIIQFRADVDSSVLLSIHKFDLEPQEELVIEDSEHFKVALIGEGDFPDERHSFQSNNYLNLHYSKNRTTSIASKIRTKFQFSFTHVHSSPCGYEEFQCRNLNCIPKSLLCNRHNNCGDNSDERECSPGKKVDDSPKPAVTVYKNNSILMISIIICAALLGIIITVFVVVIISGFVAKKKRTKDVALASTSSAPPPPPPTVAQPPVAPSIVSRIRQSFRRARNTQSSTKPEEGKPANYQVPSMYPEVPSAPEYQVGVDNPDFKIEE